MIKSISAFLISAVIFIVLILTGCDTSATDEDRSHIIMESNLNQDQSISVANQQDTIFEADSNNNTKIETVACVIRYDGASWNVLSDTGHKPINVKNILTYDASAFYIVYDFVPTKVLSFVACVDETYAIEGYQCGNSVSMDKALVYLSKPQMIDSVILNTNGEYTFTGTDITSVYIVDNDTLGSFLRINHASYDGVISVLSQNKYDWKMLGHSDTYINIQPYLNGVRQELPLANGEVAFTFQKGVDIKRIPGDNQHPDYSNVWIYGVFEVQQ